MKPAVLYFAAYVSVLNKYLYDECYFKIKDLFDEEKANFEDEDEVMDNLILIFNDEKEKVSLDDIFSQLKDSEDKTLAISLGVSLALCDNCWSNTYDEFFKKACKEIDFDMSEFNDIFASLKKKSEDGLLTEVKVTKKLKGEKLFKFLGKVVPNKNWKEKFSARYKNCLLSGPDYSIAINEMRETSREDAFQARKIINNLLPEMEETYKILTNNSSKISSAIGKLKSNGENNNKDVEKIIDELKSTFKVSIEEAKNEIPKTIERKELASSYYTISFVGRTKAGKSTLHSVLLGGINKEFIGYGSERTTKFNRVYKWNGIRIIDTPGIASAEKDGENDTLIAKSIVDESDLICFVLSSDMTQESELSFLKELKEQNKSIVILLNYKENISRDIDDFLEDPLAWYNATGNNSLEGHYKRIHEYADKYYNNDYFSIYPVQLAAAQESMKDIYDSSEKKKLYEGSRIQDFIDNIRIQILEDGKIKRSQTILNGTNYYLEKYKKELESKISGLKNIREKIEDTKDKSQEEIRKEGKKTIKNLRDSLLSTFNMFEENEIRQFANDNYDVKKNDLDGVWQDFFEDSGFERRITGIVENSLEEYRKNVEEVIKEALENLAFEMESFSMNFSTTSIFDSKFLVGMTGTLTMIAGGITAIIGGAAAAFTWPLLIAGGIITAISFLFKSKQKRIEEAQEKLYSSVRDSFESGKMKNIDTMVGKTSSIIAKTEKSIENTFNSIVNGIKEIENNLQPLYDDIKKSNNLLNKLYGLRILNFAGKSNRFSLNDNETLNKIEVIHDFAKEMTIRTSLVSHIDTAKLTDLLQEDIKFEVMNNGR